MQLLRTILRIAMTAVVLSFFGCAGGSSNDPPATTGSAKVDVSRDAMLTSDITRIEVSITGPDITEPIVATLSGNSTTGWSAMINDIPAGPDRTFSCSAYDGDTLIYDGYAYPVDVLAGQTTLVTIFMQEVDPPPPFYNSAPRITGLTVSDYSVAPGDTVTLTVTAEDPDTGDTLTYAWSSPAGSFSSAGTATTDWTAPAATGAVVLQIRVSDSLGAAASLEISIVVGESDTAGAFVVAAPNSAPLITNIVPDPAQIDIDDYTYIDLTASDPDGDSLTYSWHVEWPCEGFFDDPTLEDPVFTLSAIETEWDDCSLTVSVSDSRGGYNSATIALATGPDICDGEICGPQARLPGELIWDTWRHHDGDDEGAAITYDPAYGDFVLVGTHIELDDPVIVVDLFTTGGSYIDSNFPTGFSEQQRGYAAATDSTGNGYLGGWSDTNGSSGLVRQHPADWLDDGWVYEFDGPGVYDVLVDQSDRIWFIGIAGGGSDPKDIRISRIPASGPTGPMVDRFVRPGATLHEGGAIAADTAGNVVACASFSNGAGYDLWLGKYKINNLDTVFSSTWSSPGDRDDICEDVAVDGLGNIYVVGRVSTASGNDAWVAKFDPTGTFVGEVTYDTTGDDTARGIAIAGNGILYVGGEGDGGGQQAFLRAYRPTLALYWAVQPGALTVTDVMLDPATGDVLVTGTTGVDRNMYLGRFVP